MGGILAGIRANVGCKGWLLNMVAPLVSPIPERVHRIARVVEFLADDCLMILQSDG
ncbi:hypothetical protein [Povalibacter sp.]|uniref:hypothetical protein n=1 Tax=Povalibacter sp. TaxID=1962978 RepID=UPI002F426AA5